MKVAVVTGSPKGIGYELCKQILSSPELNPIILYATYRSGTAPTFTTHHPESKVIPVYLDQGDLSSVRALADQVKREQGKIDILAVNAGNGFLTKTEESIKDTFAVNFHGALALHQAFIPLANEGARFFTTSSGSANCIKLSDRIEKVLFDPALTIQQLEGLLAEYEAHAPAAYQDWPATEDNSWTDYSIVKLAVNVYTRVLARDHPNITFTCADPGCTTSDTQARFAPQFSAQAKPTHVGAALCFNAIVGSFESGSYIGNRNIFSQELGSVQPNWYNSGISVGDD